MPNSATRADLGAHVHNRIGLSRHECAGLVDEVLDTIADALARGEDVKLSGFGTFLLRDKSARAGRNPKTGVEVTIAPRRVLGFRAAEGVRARLAAG